jgi:hypothetical protein
VVQYRMQAPVKSNRMVALVNASKGVVVESPSLSMLAPRIVKTLLFLNNITLP